MARSAKKSEALILGTRTVSAVYNRGKLIFGKSEAIPKDGTEVVVTFVQECGNDDSPAMTALRELRGRGRGERLLQTLLAARRADREREGHGHPS